MYSTEAAVKFDSALDQYLSDCAAQQEVSLPVPDRGAFINPNQRRYGLLDPVGAEDTGYQFVQSETAANLKLFQADLTDEQNRAIGDIENADSCVARMAADITKGNDPRWEDVQRVQESNFASLSIALESPSVKAATERWRACFVETTGESVADPFEAASRGVQGAWGDSEVEVALADIACKESVGWTNTILEEETRVQIGFMNAEPDVFSNALELQTEIMQAANDYISPP